MLVNEEDIPHPEFMVGGSGLGSSFIDSRLGLDIASRSIGKRYSTSISVFLPVRLRVRVS